MVAPFSVLIFQTLKRLRRSRYFPLEVVTEGLLEIYQTLLGLKFAEVQNAERWHPDVLMYDVR